MPPKEAPEKASNLTKALGNMFDTGKFSDFTFICGKEQFKVHKTVLYGQSEYLAGVCDGEFKEAKENCLRFDDENPEIVKAMIKFLYTADYDYPGEQAGFAGPLHFYADVASLADMVLLDHLHRLSVEKCRSVENWNVQDLKDAVEVGFTASTKSLMQQALTTIAADYLDATHTDRVPEIFDRVGETTAAFGIDLAKEIARRLKQEKKEKTEILSRLQCDCVWKKERRRYGTCSTCKGDWCVVDKSCR